VRKKHSEYIFLRGGCACRVPLAVEKAKKRVKATMQAPLQR